MTDLSTYRENTQNILNIILDGKNQHCSPKDTAEIVSNLAQGFGGDLKGAQKDYREHASSLNWQENSYIGQVFNELREEIGRGR